MGGVEDVVGANLGEDEAGGKFQNHIQLVELDLGRCCVVMAVVVIVGGGGDICIAVLIFSRGVDTIIVCANGGKGSNCRWGGSVCHTTGTLWR